MVKKPAGKGVQPKAKKLPKPAKKPATPVQRDGELVVTSEEEEVMIYSWLEYKEDLRLRGEVPDGYQAFRAHVLFRKQMDNSVFTRFPAPDSLCGG